MLFIVGKCHVIDRYPAQDVQKPQPIGCWDGLKLPCDPEQENTQFSLAV